MGEVDAGRCGFHRACAEVCVWMQRRGCLPSGPGGGEYREARADAEEVSIAGKDVSIWGRREGACEYLAGRRM